VTAHNIVTQPLSEVLTLRESVSRRGAIAFEVRIDSLGDAIDDLLFMVLIANVVYLP
jgi:hypothetical protein